METDVISASPEQLVKLAPEIISSYVLANRVHAADVPGLINSIHAALVQLASGGLGAATTPAVPIKKCIGDDFIICLEHGMKLTMLKRYLRSQYNMSPEEYRKKWGLPHDYPMVAPAYARLRSAFAKKIGLGRIPAGQRRRRA